MRMYRLFVRLLLHEFHLRLGGCWAFVLRDVIYALLHNMLAAQSPHRSVVLEFFSSLNSCPLVRKVNCMIYKVYIKNVHYYDIPIFQYKHKALDLITVSLLHVQSTVYSHSRSLTRPLGHFDDSYLPPHLTVLFSYTCCNLCPVCNVIEPSSLLAFFALWYLPIYSEHYLFMGKAVHFT